MIDKKMNYGGIGLAIASMMLVSPNSFAQTSAGSILQQIRSEAPAPAIPRAVPSSDLGAAKVDVPEAVKINVTRFLLSGNTKISTEDLELVLEPYINHLMTFEDLQGAANTIFEYYGERGLLVRADFPAQEVTDGVVKIQITEAVFGGVKIDNRSERVSTSTITDWFDASLPKQEPLSVEELSRALLNFNDRPDVSGSGSLQEGAAAGETVLGIVVTDKSVFDSVLGLDNIGSSSTGSDRVTASANLNGALGFGEQATFYGLHTEGTDFGRLGFTLPVGSDGLRVGVNASNLNYRVITKSFSGLAAHGSSTVTGFEASYPLIRTQPTNLILTTNYNYSQFNNANATGTASLYNTKVLLAGLNANMMDGFFGGGVTTANATLSTGSVNLDYSPSLVGDMQGANARGGFSKLRYSLSRSQSVFWDLSAYLSLSGQAANKNMDSSEQFYLGGPSAVRAYATGQGNASQGTLFTAELRQTLPSDFQATAFYDYGMVQTYKNPNFPSAPIANQYSIQGYGLSLGWTGPYRLQIKATWAQSFGTLPNSIEESFKGNGGGVGTSRLWLTASFPFDL